LILVFVSFLLFFLFWTLDLHSERTSRSLEEARLRGELDGETHSKPIIALLRITYPFPPSSPLSNLRNYLIYLLCCRFYYLHVTFFLCPALIIYRYFNLYEDLRREFAAGHSALESAVEEAQLYKARAERERDRDGDYGVYVPLSDERQGRGGKGQAPSLSELSTPTAVMHWKGEEKKRPSTNAGKDRTERNTSEIEREIDRERDRERDRVEGERRRRTEEEHRSMQAELMRTSEALETLQQLLRDRDKTSARKERLFISEKDLLVSEAENATRAFQGAKEEVLYLLRERDYMVKGLDDFSRQLCDLAGEELERESYNGDGSYSPLSHMKTKGVFSSQSQSAHSSSSSGRGTPESQDSRYLSKGPGSVGAGGMLNSVNGTNIHGISSNNNSSNSSSNCRVNRVAESEGAQELDGFIRSMQVVVNDRKRVRRLCRHQQLSIMALR
jgi:cell division septum initiation protein DivIVA